jgi:glyoxylase-like metal-dependent hydrolase (beta-lactamase superfamily II)
MKTLMDFRAAAGRALAVGLILGLLIPGTAVLVDRSAEWAQGAPAYVPAPARGPAIPQDKGYLVREIAGGLYWVADGVYQAMFLVTGRGVIAVDAPPNLGKKYLQAIADVTSEPVTHVVYSHAHRDHIGAANLFPKSATYIAHRATAEILARAKDPARPVPTVTFANSYTLRVGNQTLMLDYKGANHEPGNIFIYAPRQKVLMLVDVIFPGWVPFAQLALSTDIPGFMEAHQQVLRYDFTTFIGGHVTRLGTRQDVEIALEYVNSVRFNARRALQTVDFMGVAKETGFEDPFRLFDRYLDAVAKACADPIIPKWRDRLGGVEAFTQGHCWVMQNSLRID